MDIKVVINVMIELFAILILGFVLAKVDIVDSNTNKKISALVVKVTLPALIIYSVLGSAKKGGIDDVIDYLLYGCLFYLVLPLIAFLVMKLLCVKPGSRGTYQFMIIFSNCSFMGYPVLAAAFGDKAIFLSSIFNMPFNIFAFSYGIYLLSKDGKEKADFSIKKLINPGIIASIIAFIIYCVHIPIPTVVGDVLGSVGGITTPLSMIILGASLAAIPIKDVFKEYRIYILSIVRLIILPAATFFIMRLVTDDTMLIGIATGTMAMPVASLCVMLSNQYDANTKLASTGVFITTLLSVFTIPLVFWWLF